MRIEFDRRKRPIIEEKKRDFFQNFDCVKEKKKKTKRKKERVFSIHFDSLKKNKLQHNFTLFFIFVS